MWKDYNFQQLVKRYGVSDTVSMADDIVNQYHISYEETFKGMLESNSQSEYALKEYFKEKYRTKDSEGEEV